MTDTLQLDQITIIQLDDAPKLLVEWSPRWRDFVTSIGPAFARSGPPLAGEAPLGIVTYRRFVASLLLQSLLLFAMIALPRQINRLRPYAPPKLQPYEVIYYSGDELPRTEDLSGSQSGKSATAGGREAHHRTQTIRIARGNSLSERVVDAPNLKLPSSPEAVANLLTYKSNPALPIAPAPTADGLHSSLNAPAHSARVIAPAPEINGEHSRTGFTLTSIIPPAPNISAKQDRSAPSMHADVVPPAPIAPSEHTLIAPRLDAGIIAPAPNIFRQHTLAAPSLNTNVIAPAPTQVSAAESRSTPALSARVIAPAPLTTGNQVPQTRVQMTNVAVVPPPVSAPERDDVRKAKLNLPAPSIVAPPPSADSAHNLRRLESGVATSSPTVVPPPPTQAAAPSFMSSIIGKIFGTQDVVPPPPGISSANRSGGSQLAANVVPPPPPNVSASSRTSAGALAANIVPPPPSSPVAGTNGISRSSPRTPSNNIVPPPPSVSGSETAGSETGHTLESGTFRRTSLSASIVPPPPSITSGSPNAGRRLSGFGDANSVLAPPKTTGGNNSDKSGVVASAQPGSNLAVPGTHESSLAMSPSGEDEPGIGGAGGTSGIGHGEGPGSGLTSKKPLENSGAGKNGSGRGFDQTARGGISTTPGPGGAGGLATGSPAVPGVDVHGGSTIITLPSFGSNAPAPTVPQRSKVKSAEGPAITIVATSRSGGAFNFYGELPGNNYSVYIDTNLGTVVMQFAEANPGPNSQLETLTGPEAIRTDLPAKLPHARMVVKCKLTTSGNVTHLQVLEAGPATMTAKIVAALPGWKFRPATRGAQPVEVNAILGFNINTNDRY